MEKISRKPISATATATVVPEPTTRDQSRAIGSILVEQGRIGQQDVEEIQRFAAQNSIRFGDAALQLNLLTQNDIDVALAQQFNYPVLARGGKNGRGRRRWVPQIMVPLPVLA